MGFKSLTSELEYEFPIDTVQQIHKDIEKLLENEDSQEVCSQESDRANSIPHKSEKPVLEDNSYEVESKLMNHSVESYNQASSFNFILNEVMMINADESYLNTSDLLQLCMFELKNLRNELQMCSSTVTNATCQWSKSETDQNLLKFVWDLFDVHEILVGVFKVASHKQQDDANGDSSDFTCNASRLISFWYVIVEQIKNTVTKRQSMEDGQPNIGLKLYLQQFWKLTRQLRSMHWIRLVQSLSD